MGSRRRMAVLAAAAALYVLVESAFNVAGPLWATRDLALANADWARLRSLSEFGGLLGILGLGTLALRLGARWISALALAGVGMALAGLSSGVGAAWWMVVFGAFVSVVYVGFNTLAQGVTERRRGLANAMYRAAGAAAAIVAPAIATHAADALGAYAPVLMTSAAVVGLAGFLITCYGEPAGGQPPPMSFAAAFSAWRRAFTLSALLAFIAVTRGFGVAVAAVGAFAALRFTRELGLGEPEFGLLCSGIAVANLASVLASGWLVDRLGVSRTLAFAWTGCSIAAMTMGLADALWPAIAAYACFVPLHSICSVPLSLWSGRIAAGSGLLGPDPAAVFTVQKVYQSGVTMLAMAALAALEPRVGMATLMWCGGLLGLPMAVAILRLGVAQHA